MNTRRYPRTMVEAFGPYTTDQLQPMKDPRDRRRQDWVLYLVAVLAVAAILIFQP